jgi:mRNA interferase RelE/StbE
MPVTFAEAALDDLRRLGPARARRALAQIWVLADGGDPGTPLAAGAPYRKLAPGAGALRVTYAADRAAVTVGEDWVDGARAPGAAAAEALHRMQAADAPEVIEHAQLLERLGRITATMPVPPHRLREPVPDWLADALVDDAGLTRLELAAMDARTAFERWNQRNPALHPATT